MSKKNDGKPIDLRKQRAKEDRNLMFLVLFSLVFVGGGFIWLIYGIGALIGALPCLVGGSFMILCLWGLFVVVEKFREPPK